MKNKDQIEKLAIRMVKKNGLANLSRSELCAKAGVPDGSFPYIMGCTFSELLESLRKKNIAEPNVRICKSRVDPRERQKDILNSAIFVAKKRGYTRVTRIEIANHAGISTGSVSRYFGTMRQLKKKIVKTAVKNEILEIVAQALVVKDPLVKNISESLKAKAIQSIN